jgi:peptidyl-tRNA hydrolase
MTWLVAGLGNPGEGYAGTRHNVGAMVVDELANRAGERFRKARFVPADVAEITADGERMLLVKSRTFMNESLDFVLRPFSKKEEEVVGVLVDQAADAALSLARHGLSPTQDRYNRPGPMSND